MSVESSRLVARARVHAALGDPASGDRGHARRGDASPGEIAHVLELPTNLVAHHVNVLRDAGLIGRARSEGDRRRTYLRLRPETLAGLAAPPLPAVGQVVFVCTHNAGRSQMTLGFFTHLADDHAVAWSGGSEPGIDINPAAVAAMAERGIDISSEYPKPWTDEIARAADVIITMGCGDACPIFPGKRYEDWTVDDPADLTLDDVRPIRDEIERRVRRLLDQLAIRRTR